MRHPSPPRLFRSPLPFGERVRVRGTACGETSRRVALALAAILAAGCDQIPEAAPARAQATAPPPATRVATVRPERATIRRTTEQPGQIEAIEVTAIHARVAGFVRTMAVDIGDPVKKGQVLVELWVPELEAESKEKHALIDQAEADRAQAAAAVEVAEAMVASAEARREAVRAGIRRAEADVARWQAEYRRADQLTRESAVTGSLRDETRSKRDAAEAARDEVKAQVASADAAVREARAHLAKARADVVAAAARVAVARFAAERVAAMAGYAKVEAPFDGVVTRRLVDTGHLTVPGGTGEPLLVVARSDRVTIAVGVPEADAPLVDAGDPARVRLQALGGRAFEGKVTRTSWSLDAATRTLRAEIDLPNPDGALRPGLYAYATIIAEEHAGALTLPAAAVVGEGDKTYCVVVADRRAARRPIRVGLNDGARVEVLSGLDGGEVVVSANAAALADGQPVEPQPAAGKGAKP
jgi:HlyD family secretion protein